MVRYRVLSNIDTKLNLWLHQQHHYSHHYYHHYCQYVEHLSGLLMHVHYQHSHSE